MVIPGGTTFDNSEAYSQFLDSFVINLDRLRYRKDWKDTLQEELGPTFDVFQARMPNSTNANYAEWKIMFDKILEKVDDDIVLIGHSLGGLFLVKYLSENNSAKKIKSLFLVSTPFDEANEQSLGSFVIDASKVESIEGKTDHIFLYYSKDDPLVRLSESDKYLKKLPNALLQTFDNRGHFRQEKFPEIVNDLQNTL